MTKHTSSSATDPVSASLGAVIDPDALDERVWEALKDFNGFTEADVTNLEAIRERCEGAIEAAVETFYDHLMTNEETRQILHEHDVGGRLKDSQRSYLRSLLAGQYGADYMRDRIRVGLTHERVGLPLRWYLGGYWKHVESLTPIALEGCPPERIEQYLSLLKILTLDTQLITESYLGRTLALVRLQNEQLEELVTQRTKQLTKWERLAVVGSLSAKVAHEIRNPLSSLSLNTELLADELAAYGGVDTREARELLDSILAELERLSRIVDEYLQFARMPRLDVEMVDVETMMRSISSLVSGELAEQRIELRIDVPDDTPALHIDPNQVRQALLNLIRNARESMRDGGSLRITVDRLDNGGVRIAVDDDGIGFEIAEIDRLFDPFFTTKDTGTGLGLPFVQQVMQEHGGRVHATGRAGSGARFELLFPDTLVSSKT